MQIGTVEAGGRLTPVVVLDAERLGDFSGVFPSVLALIEAGPDGLACLRDALPRLPVLALAEVRHRAPLVPVQMRDCLVFEAHLKNSFAAGEKLTGRKMDIPEIWYKQPIYYKANRLSVIGHGQTVRWPAYANYLDVELELAIVIGKGGMDISKEDAPAHIWGYTVFNDVSARDAQMIEMAGQLGPAKGKDFETGNILGPWITTADEIPHPAALDMEVHVNGERWGGGNSCDMHHDFADIIAFISQSERLHPGEVIGSGTVGTGCGLEIGKMLAPGDQFELTIEKIGTLANRIEKP